MEDGDSCDLNVACDNSQSSNNDQRDSVRPANGKLSGAFVCDIGTFELFAHTADISIDGMTAPDRAYATDPITVTITVQNDPGATTSATGVTITTDPLPASFTVNSADVATAWATTALHGAAAWLGALVVQPLVEETLFRGLLQGQLLRTRFGGRVAGGISAANLSVSAAFVAVHFVYHTPQWALATLPPSLALGWLRERRDSTWAPIVVHAAFNLEFFATAAAFAR